MAKPIQYCKVKKQNKIKKKKRNQHQENLSTSHLTSTDNYLLILAIHCGQGNENWLSSLFSSILQGIKSSARRFSLSHSPCQSYDLCCILSGAVLSAYCCKPATKTFRSKENSEGKSLPSETSALGPAWRGMGSIALGTSTVSGASLGARKLLKTKSAQGPDFVKSRGFKVTPAQRNPLSPTSRPGYGAPRPAPGLGPTSAWAWEAAGDRGISRLRANRLPPAQVPRVTPRTMTPEGLQSHPHLGCLGFLQPVMCVEGFLSSGPWGKLRSTHGSQDDATEGLVILQLLQADDQLRQQLQAEGIYGGIPQLHHGYP